MRESSLILLKPEALMDRVEFEILRRFQNEGFSVEDSYLTTPSEKDIREHYKESFKTMVKVISEKKSPEEAYENVERLVNWMTKPLIAAQITGEDAVSGVREYAGSQSQPKDNDTGTIRKDYRPNETFAIAEDQERAVQNVIHSSDSPDNAKLELNNWFNRFDRSNDNYTPGTVVIFQPDSDEFRFLDELVKNGVEYDAFRRFSMDFAQAYDLADKGLLGSDRASIARTSNVYSGGHVTLVNVPAGSLENNLDYNSLKKVATISKDSGVAAKQLEYLF